MWYVLLYFLFFKQKMAYDVRISDWSSDVCSSDLPLLLLVLVLSVVEDLADRRVDVGRYLDEIEPDRLGLGERLPNRNDADLLAVFVDEAHPRHLDQVVYARSLAGQRLGNPWPCYRPLLLLVVAMREIGRAHV